MERSLKGLPKIDLHCHLDGSMRPELVQKLLAERGQVLEFPELLEQIQAPPDCPSLAEYLGCFRLLIECLQTKEGLEQAAELLANDAALENVKYLEVRLAPSFSTMEGLKVRDVLESVQKGLLRAEERFDIRTGIIVCAMRHMPEETNIEMLREAAEFLGSGVVACDLAGDEQAYPNAEFAELFRQAARLGLPYTIHSGECGSTENIRTAVELGAGRIGHGIAMWNDRELIRICAEKRIGVELCPTSNFQTKAVRSWDEYPLRTFMREGLPVSVNTDNRTVSDTSSTAELEKVTDHYALSEEEQKQIYLWSVEMAFTDDDCKNQLVRKWSI